MLLHLIAFGVGGLISEDVDYVTGTVSADDEQTVAVIDAVAAGGAASGLPVGAPIWPRPFDPSDRAPYAYDFSAVLDDGETIAELLRVTMSATGAALGVLIDTDSDRLPMLDTAGLKTQVWFKVDDAYQSNAAFAGDGTQIGVSMLVRTSAAPAREYERSAILLVRQQ